ncbi:MAG: bifunctional adenosylcobinamide kinase/adenosylcobinamide-phosphate guanylyltransferase [Bacteroidetes bacterium]|nr:bifunctional adenosylcobinamide kinase/adenosylcobinamide-phosphate guanylyltransferase [Bacteroidota bacterium]
MRSKIVFVTGGQRSGKSSFAQELALKKSPQPMYLATARKWDEDFNSRIKRHQADRGPEWINEEKEKYISEVDIPENTVVVVDCVTLWLTNFFIDNNHDVEVSLEQAKKEFEKFLLKNIKVIIVSNEVGMSLHAQTETGRKFTDLQGWMNQFLAKKAEEVYLMISGIPQKIK